MDGDLGAFMQSVLSDPEQLAKITQLAQGLMDHNESPPAPMSEPERERPPTSKPMGEDRILSLLSRLLSEGKSGQSRSTALLTAMRPYMRPEKQEKLDRAMKIARIAHIATAVMGELGGGRNGV